MIRLIIAGSRHFDDPDFMEETLDFFLQNITEPIVVLSGCNGKRDENTGEVISGADLLGEEYAKKKGYDIERFPADWKKHKRSASPFRNLEMAKVGTHAVVFWDGVSRGSKNMIDLARKYNLKLKIVYFNRKQR